MQQYELQALVYGPKRYRGKLSHDVLLRDESLQSRG